MKSSKVNIDPQLAEDIAAVKELLNDYFKRFGNIYFWDLARKARAISLVAMLTNFLVCINAAFIAMVQPETLSLDFSVAKWAYQFTAACSVFYLLMAIISQISLSLDVFQKQILFLVLASLTVTLSVFSSFIGFFDSLTWFIFFLYTMLGFVLLDWRQVMVTDTAIVFLMIAITIFHQSFPYPVQAYLFLEDSDIASMSFLDLISAWSICGTAAFASMWVMSFLLRTWHVQGIEQVSQAHLDPLTQVLKRRDVLDALENEVLLAARDKTPLTVAVLDLDAFKLLNEQHGHVFGDRALAYIAAQLKEVTRAQDLVGRYGGQEFIVVFPGCNIDIAVQVLERLKLKLSVETLRNNAQDQVKMSFSAGVAHLRPGDQKYENIIARADRALGQAKQVGGNKIIPDAN